MVSKAKKKQFEWKMLIFSIGQFQIVKMLKRKSELVEEASFYTAKKNSNFFPQRLVEKTCRDIPKKNSVLKQ